MIPSPPIPPLERRAAPGPHLLTDVAHLLDRSWRWIADHVLPAHAIRRADIGMSDGEVREWLRQLYAKPGRLQ